MNSALYVNIAKYMAILSFQNVNYKRTFRHTVSFVERSSNREL